MTNEYEVLPYEIILIYFLCTKFQVVSNFAQSDLFQCNYCNYIN